MRPTEIMNGLMRFVLLLCSLPFLIFQAFSPLDFASARGFLVLVCVMAHFFSQENELCPTNWVTANANFGSTSASK